MATAERTEAATPRRRQQARERGEVARSPELVGAAVLLVGLLALRWLGAGVLEHLARFTREAFGIAAAGDLGAARAQTLGVRTLAAVWLALAPLLGIVAVVAVVSNVAQVGFLLTGQPLRPQASRINPLAGLQRLFSRRSAVELVKALAKVAIVGYVGYRFLADQREALGQLAHLAPAPMGGMVADLSLRMALQMAGAFCVLAALDYGYQRFQHEINLRMTRQEVKEDLRASEGDAQLKGWRRQRMREMGRRRMMTDVPRATVVLANPQHYAVALRYQPQEMPSPRVLAKGQGYMALRIRAVAQAHGVPVVENPPLARALYGTVEVGQEIPVAFYRAVAEVLAAIYRTDHARRAAAFGQATGGGRR
ncbi:MAG: flagellar biosynthesis protein FlhB [Armatimonadetes bacterium]|nr:flagellar biosynthesis protein FlhB [Armatimonadota bacterium]